ncbi:MAG: hypothetical protein EZS28_032176 [Streblomastix strix]|uniref:Uncharacterized protein n=1 Tax=Streblomastix strix TaxID=222440 RepID=A0A5J4UPD9_9EUKA|nr:MAG: hypothetical protein EZS28_032176 [Streblomastix strix]
MGPRPFKNEVLSDAFLYIDPTETCFASGSARLQFTHFPSISSLASVYSILFKGGQCSCEAQKSFRPRQKPPLGGKSTG